MYHCFQLNQEFSKEFSFLSQNISDHDNSQNVRILIKIIFPTSICLSPFKESCKESFLIPPPRLFIVSLPEYSNHVFKEYGHGPYNIS